LIKAVRCSLGYQNLIRIEFNWAKIAMHFSISSEVMAVLVSGNSIIIVKVNVILVEILSAQDRF
jgi:hypothetical protein